MLVFVFAFVGCAKHDLICYPAAITGDAKDTAQYTVEVAEANERVYEAQRVLEKANQAWFLCKGSNAPNCEKEKAAWSNAETAYLKLFK